MDVAVVASFAVYGLKYEKSLYKVELSALLISSVSIDPV
jgi:hypothetical protein